MFYFLKLIFFRWTDRWDKLKIIKCKYVLMKMLDILFCYPLYPLSSSLLYLLSSLLSSLPFLCSISLLLSSLLSPPLFSIFSLLFSPLFLFSVPFLSSSLSPLLSPLFHFSPLLFSSLLSHTYKHIHLRTHRVLYYKSKTECIIFHRWQTNTAPNTTYINETILIKQKIITLGVTLDSTLKFDSHISKIIKCCNYSLFKITQIKHLANIYSKL